MSRLRDISTTDSGIIIAELSIVNSRMQIYKVSSILVNKKKTKNLKILNVKKV